MTEQYIWDIGTPQQRETSPLETENIHKEIHDQIVKNDRELLMQHKVTKCCHTFLSTHCNFIRLFLHGLNISYLQWKTGDFIISDNMAVGHEAHPDTQLPRTQVGLRVMHRTTVTGTYHFISSRTPHQFYNKFATW